MKDECSLLSAIEGEIGSLDTNRVRLRGANAATRHRPPMPQTPVESRILAMSEAFM